MTPRKVPPIALVLLLALCGTGCGDECEALCEARKDCPTADRDTNCDAYCDSIETLNEDADCDDQYDAATDCAQEQDNVCDVDTAGCQAENAAYSECMAAYCSDEQNNCS